MFAKDRGNKLGKILLLIALLIAIALVGLLVSIQLANIFGFEEISSGVFYAAILGGIWSVIISKGWDMIWNVQDLSFSTILYYLFIAVIALVGVIIMSIVFILNL